MPLKFYNTAPYFDDFDKTKNYHRALFRPGFAVQARELTQLQTALQAQLDRFGSHVFKDGSQVLGGQASLDTEFSYVKLESSFSYGGGTLIADNYFDEALGRVVTGETTGVTATVLDATAAESGGDPLTIFVKYKTSGTDNETQVFDPEEYLTFVNGSGVTRRFKVQNALSIPTGDGSRISITEGVFFVAGTFVYTPADALLLSKYTNTPSARIVYTVSEAIVTPGEDATLTDNALGSPNEAAPGAHRYQIQLTLGTQPIDFANRDEDNLIQLMIIQDGKVRQTARTAYSELGDVLAQRTFEESGNYTVRPFQINIREHLNDEEGNGGLYTAAQGGDATKLAVGLEPSVAYVNGYRIEIEDTKYVEVDKARDSAYFNAASVQAPLGNYIRVNNLVSAPDINNFATLTLKTGTGSPISGRPVVGTARARAIESVGGGEYRLYIFDVVMTGGYTFSDVTAVYHSYGTSAAFSATLLESRIYDVADNCAVFKLPVEAVQTLRDLVGNVEMLYLVRKKYDSRTASGSAVTLSASTDEIFESLSASDWIITDTTTGAVVTASSITGGGASITFNGLPSGTGTYDFIGPSRRNLREKTKLLNEDQTKAVAVPNTTLGGYDPLSVTDVLRIKAIYMSPSLGTAATTSHKNVTDRYLLDNGQSDNFYDLSRIQLKSTATAPTGQLLVVYDYFTHGAGDYFSVDSYTGNFSSTFSYEDIPAFQGIRGLIQLRDALDFRPTKDTTGANFTGTGASVVSVIKPTSIVTTDIQYYLPRIDKIYVDKRGNFGSLKGISGVNPAAPEDPKDAMVLYLVRLGAYTFGPADVIPTMIDNKRYTMRDIGKIEKRVTKLEYYTSLSLLEKETADTQIFDGATVRFKNGFVVDGFYGHNVGAVTHPDYRVSTDKAAGKLRPMFWEDNAKLNYTAGSSSNVQKTGPLLTLAYTEVSAGVEQPYASYAEFVNPYNVFTWSGEVRLSPESDEWKETQRRPDVVVDQSGIYDSLRFIEDETNLFGTVWNEWQTNWTGVVSEESSTEVNVNNDWFGVTTTSTTTLTTTTQVNQARTGIRTTLVPDTVTTSIGDRVVEVNFVPFIRSRKIYFKATKMKPNTKVYAFFDGVDVSDFVREEATFVQYSDSTNVTSYLDVTSHPDTAGELITDASGELIGSFIIPNTDLVKFKTGSRIFRLSDSPTNSTDATTYGESIYDARGLIETKENLSISTRTARVDRTQISENRIIFDSTSSVSNSSEFTVTEWIDPLAQTFIVDTPGGIFLTAMDLYFQAKDTNIPVTLQIRTCENGIPTQRIIPFANLTKSAVSVNVSADATTATKFTFEAPVHLIQGVEYAFVVISNSDAYKLWVSELGEYDVTNTTYRITKQPYNGVMFKSQNASTWTPEQTKDIKFKMYRASFSTSVGTAVFNEVNIPTRNLQNDPIATTNASTTIRVYHPNHGHFAGASRVTLSGVVSNSGSALNGIPITEINTTHTVAAVEADSYTLVITTPATSTGRAGGTAVYATENRLMNVFQPIVQQVVLPSTSCDWDVRATSATSLAGTETPHTVSAYFKVKANDNTYLTRPHAIVSQPNYTLLSSGSKSFHLRGTLSTTLDNLSPVIDLDRLSVVTVANRIDNPSASAVSGFNQVSNYIAETAANGGSVLSKYLTRKVELNDPASALKVFLLANKPAAAGIALYYKVLPRGSDANFDSLPWVLASPDNAIPSSENPNDYSEIEYTIDETALGGEEFTSFAVKIVFTSTNSSSVPTCRDFRAIAVT